MEYLYSSYTKLVDNKIHYFVKKFMTFPEFKDVADILAGYGMHTDFEKACSICGIDDSAGIKQLFANLEHSEPFGDLHWLPIVQTGVTRNTRERHPVRITGMKKNWLAEQGAEALN